jgi:peptidyl-prolyl cis-trans isomerase C
MIRILKDPLLHFLLAGGALFALFQLMNPYGGEEYDERTIVVDRPALLEFVQFRSKIFEAGYAERELDTMSAEERERLIASYVEEEALYREAAALGLDTNDYVIKRRMVQTLEFVAGNLDDAGDRPSEDELRAYFQDHKADYTKPASLTFTHVFVSADRQGPLDSESRARKLAARLEKDGAGFTDAPRYGDRFVYNLNYVDQSKDTIAGHFGTAFADALFELAPASDRWQGPLQSAYGLHLVMLTAKTGQQIPPFVEVRGRVAADLIARRNEDRRKAVVQDIVDGYKVTIDPGVSSTLETAAE